MDLLVSITVLTMTLLQRLKYYSKSTKRLVLGGLTLTFATQVNAHAKPTRRNPLSLIQPCFWFVGVCAWAYLCPHSMACGIDSTSVLSAFGCLEYSSTRSMFELTCSFGWSQRYHDCIVLQKHEVFEGHDHEINITGHSNWEGLFQIANSSSGRGPSSLTDAPVIRNVHIIGGETSQTGGFVVQSWQKHFIVDSCSSTGVIHGTTSGHWFGGGGICGHRCSGDIRITNCWSSGEIRGDVAGGIAGREVGINGNGYTVNITNCHSTGDIGGSMSGGICGHLAGQFNGRVTITHSYSTGTIIGYRSGGICGHGAGHTHGVVDISHCYTLGEIAGDQSGGIAGARAGETDGCLKISNSYSRGNVSSGSGAGGICGGQTAWRNGIVVIENVYSSGNIICATCSGILGSIGANGESANEVHIYRSVYNGENGAKDMVGDVHAKKYDSEHNSGDLGDITQKVYCYDDGDCWDTDTIWTVIPSDEFPILQFQVSRLLSTTTGIDANGRPVQESVVPCLHYEPANGTFFVSCAFNWTDWYFGRTEYIRLYKDETFDGQGYLIGLYGMVSWDGLFIIESNSGNAPSSLADAPVIRNVHIRGGETSHEGGFVVQSGQKHFSVESCSSTGVIQGMGESPWFGGGGICGQECSGDIRITNCWSSGEIRGDRAGGIAGRQIGVDGDGHTVNIMHCHSTGDIVGNFSGGICGNQAGRENGHVMITHSYSSGKIVGYGSGGICGIGAGRIHGEVEIKKCYSLGEINGPQSGGITGAYTANQNGHVSIANCYSRGDITGSNHAGGICGDRTGHVGGAVILTNVYASGKIDHDDAGGLIGQVDDNAKAISVNKSVYNGETGEIVGGTRDADTDEKNSGNLPNIIGSVYCYEDKHNIECWNNETIWRAVENDFPVLQGMLSLVPSASRSPTPSASLSSLKTPTSTQSFANTATNTNTMIPSEMPSGTPTVTVTPSPTSSNTKTSTNTVTPSSTGTLSPSESGTFSSSSSPIQRPRRMFTKLPVQRPRPKVVNRG